jgi:hypothetical protein
MPQIIVTAGDAADLTEGTVTLRERINESDFESDRFAVNLVERLGWAVSDAIDVEERDPDQGDARPATDAEVEAPAPRELVKA